MSAIPASSDRDLLAVLGVVAALMIALAWRARGKDAPGGDDAPGDEAGSAPAVDVNGHDGPVHGEAL